VLQAVTKAVKGSTQEIDQRAAWFSKVDHTLSWPLSPPDPDNIELPLSHEQLIAVQEALRDKGYYKGGIDGLFFTGSRQSLKAFQTAKGLKPTGWLTAASLQALGLS
jgi:peptidoglycan hydrolase-like protein with peptidoglycan-binding domain